MTASLTWPGPTVRCATSRSRPELLIALMHEKRQPELDPTEVTRIAASDVALAAALIRVANAPPSAGPGRV